MTAIAAKPTAAPALKNLGDGGGGGGGGGGIVQPCPPNLTYDDKSPATPILREVDQRGKLISIPIVLAIIFALVGAISIKLAALGVFRVFISNFFHLFLASFIPGNL